MAKQILKTLPRAGILAFLFCIGYVFTPFHARAESYSQVSIYQNLIPVKTVKEGGAAKPFMAVKDVLGALGCPFNWQASTKSIQFECPDFKGAIFLKEEKLVIGGSEYKSPGEIRLIEGSVHITPGVLMSALGLRSRVRDDVLALEPGNVLIAIETMGGERSGIRIQSKDAFEYNQFVLGNPARLVIDIKDMTLGSARKTLDVNVDPVARVRASQFDPTSVRIVVDLMRPSAPRFSRTGEGRELVVEFAAILDKLTVNQKGRNVIIGIHATDEFQVNSFEIRAPDRVVIDLRGVQVGENLKDNTAVNIPPIIDVRLAQNQKSPPVARVVIDCYVIPAYRMEFSENRRQVNVIFTFPALYGRHIAVDAGHGGKDPGAIGAGGVEEKGVNLKTALMLARYLQQVGAKVTMIRTNDTFVELKQRAAIANSKKADVFVSIHANALPQKPDVSGTEVYYYSEEGKVLAEVVDPMLTQASGIPSRGVKRARFVVIKATSMPAILVEIGYLTNYGDRKLLQNDVFLANTAAGIFNGLEAYFGGKKLLRIPQLIDNPALAALVNLQLAIEPEPISPLEVEEFQPVAGGEFQPPVSPPVSVPASPQPGLAASPGPRVLAPIQISPGSIERSRIIHQLAEEVPVPDVNQIRESLTNKPLDTIQIQDIPEDLQGQAKENNNK